MRGASMSSRLEVADAVGRLAEADQEDVGIPEMSEASRKRPPDVQVEELQDNQPAFEARPRPGPPFDALLTSVLSQGEHPLKLLQEQAEREKQSDHAVHDNGTWHGIWPSPSRSEWNARRHHGLLWPRGSHEVDAVQTARKEYKWKDIPKADRPAFHAAAKARWQVWVDNGAVEVLSKAQADEVRARLKSTGKQSCLLSPRFVYTDKHDGLRTPSKPLPLKANARLVVPGFQDITAYLVRRCSSWKQDLPALSPHVHGQQALVAFQCRCKECFLEG